MEIQEMVEGCSLIQFVLGLGLDGSVDVVYDKKNVWVVCVVIDHPSSRTGPHVGPREEGRTRACTTSEPMKFMCMDCVRPAVADRSILLL